MLSHSMKAGYKDQLPTISVVFMGWISIRIPSKTTSYPSRKQNQTSNPWTQDRWLHPFICIEY